MVNRIQSFRRDLIEIAVERHNKGLISRRRFVQGLALLGATPTFIRSGPAAGQVNEIVLVNWGGDAIDFMTRAFAAPYEQESGVSVIVDGSGPSQGKIRAMVESGNVTWDVCDSGGGSSILLGEGGYVREIDYTVVDQEKLFPGFAFPHGVTNYIYSFVLAYNTDEFGDRRPSSWRDFFNLEDFPGMRSLRKDVLGHIEVALMGSGLAKEDVYPLTPDKEKLAYETIRKILPDTIFWSSGGESQQFMRNEEVVMGCFWNTRVKVIHEESDGLWDWTWNEAIVLPGAWVVPKGNPAGDAVWPFIASMQEPARQVLLFELFGNAPANPAAAALVPEELKKFNATDPDNYALQLPVDSQWYGENVARANSEYLDLIQS